MRTLNKWMRRIHRWLVIPFLLVVISLITGTVLNGGTFTLPNWLNIIAIGSLLLLLLTGVYMFVQHYWVKLKRNR